MARFLVLIVGLWVWPNGTIAAARPNAPSLTCSVIQGLVASRGELIVNTGQVTYERYIRDRSFCAQDEIAEPDFVRSSDTPECLLYRCVYRPMPDKS
jgi:hypothetical protein